MTCSSCHEAENSAVSATAEPGLDGGDPRATLTREYGLRRASRALRGREAGAHLGGQLLALREPLRGEAASRNGELNEKAIANSIEARTADSLATTMLNRRMPGGQGEIDLIAVAATGVFVIDATDSTGRVRVKTPSLGRAKLLIDGRDRTMLIDDLDRQVQAVRAALDAAGRATVPVQGVLCFTQADLPLFGAPRIQGHLLLYRKALAGKLYAGGVIDAVVIDELASELNRCFPPG